MPTIHTVLLDLDGVIRHFDPARQQATEQRHGLAAGEILAVAFADALIGRLVTGAITRAQWVAAVGRAVGNPAAAEEFFSDRGTVDPAMLDLVDDLRRRGLLVAVLTNGTDTIAAELVELGIDDRFDAVFSTADIGWAKPDRRAFAHVCSALAIEPAGVFFTDDSPGKLGGAVELGMTARPFVGVDDCRRTLAALGVAVGR
ncbi:MAG: HAD-IA family hydrolase [Actinomycetota bacterium]